MKFRIGCTALMVSASGLMSVLVSGCGRLGVTSTADLVNHDDGRACSAPDVYSTLQSLVTGLTGKDAEAAKGDDLIGRTLRLTRDTTLKFDATTFDRADTTTHTISCSTSVSAKVGDQTLPPTRMAYRVQPSSSANGGIVVTADGADDLGRRVAELAGAATFDQSHAAPAQNTLAPAAGAAISSQAEAPPVVPPSSSGDDQNAVQTRFGKLSVDDDQYVLLNDHRVQPAISGNYSLSLGPVFTFGDRDLVVATDAAGTGGAACLGRVAVLVADGSGVHSPGMYGTCAEVGDVKRVGDHLVTRMHGYAGPGESEAVQDRAAKEMHTFVFTSDGHATDNGKAAELSPF